MAERQTGWRRLLKRPVVVALLLTVGAEAGLQVLAYVEFRVRIDRYWFRGDATKRRVVCLGDGFTFGVGATADASYPAQLQLLLGDSWSVRNAGAVGRDSGSALRRLSELLLEERPEVVVLTTGRLDAVTRPARVQSLRVQLVFEWRVQILALLRTVAGGSDSSDVGLGFVGDWHYGSVPFSFGADGKLKFGGVPGEWRYEESQLYVEFSGGEPIALTWRIEGDRLRLAGDFSGGQISVMRGAPSAGLGREIESLLRREAYSEARWCCDVVLRTNPTAGVRALLVEACWFAGDRVRARTEFDALVSELAGDDPSHLVERCRMTMGESEAALELVQFCRDHPAAGPIVDDVRWRSGSLASPTEATSAILQEHFARMAALCATAGVQLLNIPYPGGQPSTEAMFEVAGAEELWREKQSLSVAGYGTALGYRQLAEVIAAQIRAH